MNAGEAQIDIGEALVKQAGVLRKVIYFALVLPHSDAIYIQVRYNRSRRGRRAALPSLLSDVLMGPSRADR